jgi:hypothetical protein
VLFKYIDSNNYIGIELKRNSTDTGSIRLYKSISGVRTDIEILPCDRNVSFLPKCFGYEVNINTTIEIFNYNPGIVILYNGVVIYNIPVLEDIVFKQTTKSGIGLNGLNSFQIKELMIKELGIEDYIKFTHLNPVENTKAKPMVVEDTPPPKNIKYNPKTNTFDDIISHKVNETSNPDKCSAFEKEERYMCNYIIKATNGVIDIKTETEERVAEIVKSNCLSTMKNESTCAQVVDKINPVKRNV